LIVVGNAVEAAELVHPFVVAYLPAVAIVQHHPLSGAQLEDSLARRESAAVRVRFVEGPTRLNLFGFVNYGFDSFDENRITFNTRQPQIIVPCP